MRRIHVYISGRVQGVAFRARTHREAARLGLGGWVRNLPDGRVEAIFEGPDEKITEMLAWCRKGPSLALVKGVELNEETCAGDFRDFTIWY